MFEDLAEKSALATGASSGLGLHFAQLPARHDASVTLAAGRRDAHRGRFMLASEPGIGTTVTFNLPPDRIAA